MLQFFDRAIIARFFCLALFLGALAWSSSASAITDATTVTTTVSNPPPETPGQSVHFTAQVTKDDGTKVAVPGKAEGSKVTYAIPPHAKTVKVVETTEDKNGKTTEKRESKAFPIADFKDGIAVTLAEVASNIKQGGTATHNTAPPKTTASAFKPAEIVPAVADRFFFEFGFGGGESWTKTTADSFGTGIGPGTFFPNTNSSPFFAIEAGAFLPVVPGVAVGPVAKLVTGDLSSTTLTQTTPSGVVSSSQITRGVEFDAMGRVYLAFPFTYWNGSIYVQGGVAVARYTGSMVNTGIETFQGSVLTTSPIVGGGLQVPVCPVFGIPAEPNGVCTLTFFGEYDHVAVNKTFDTGITGASSATAEAKSADRVEFGFRFITDGGTDGGTALGYLAPVLNRNYPSDIRLKRDIAEVGHLDNGLGLYRYRYLWSDQVYVGVMAQEVAQVVPGAVIVAADGYLRVDYAKLGTHLQTFEQWVASGRPHEAI